MSAAEKYYLDHLSNGGGLVQDMDTLDKFTRYHLTHGGVLLDVYVPRGNTPVREVKNLVGQFGYDKKKVMAKRRLVEEEFRTSPVGCVTLKDHIYDNMPLVEYFS